MLNDVMCPCWKEGFGGFLFRLVETPNEIWLEIFIAISLIMLYDVVSWQPAKVEISAIRIIRNLHF
jgi:hypothetical protein